MPAAASPCLASSSAVATSRQPASRGDGGGERDRLGRRRRVRVGDQRRGRLARLTARPRRSPPRGRRPPRPPPPHQTKVSRLPFGPGRPEEAKPRIGEARARGPPAATARIASRRSAGVADDALADPLAAELELRLDHRQQLAARREAARDRGQDLGQRDEGDVDRRQSRARRAGRPGSSSRALSRSITVTRGSSRSCTSICP